MGLFDNIICQHPLPIKLKGVNKMTFQSKDTPDQFLGLFIIRDNGELWVEESDVEDRSDPSAKGISRLIGMMTHINPRWAPTTFTGEVTFYASLAKNYSGWIEFKAVFSNGKLVGDIELVKYDKPTLDEYTIISAVGSR